MIVTRDMRYALYFAAAAEDRLTGLGNAWLGRDPLTGTPLQRPQIDGVPADRFAELTTNPRRYGFHGTLKAPFHLRPGLSEAALLKACSVLAAEIAPYEIAGLSVNRLGNFLALTPAAAEKELAAFAALCVRHFEPYRAPLSEADLERRRQSNLTPRQDAYLAEWGYPYIFDEFRFHLTLSNKLEDAAEGQLLAAGAERHFRQVTGQPLVCRHFAVFAEPQRDAPFRIVKGFELTGKTLPSAAGECMTRKENA